MGRGLVFRRLAVGMVVSVGMAGLVADRSTASSVTRPEGFRAQSLTWTTPTEGWVMGAATCAGQPCTPVLRTRNGGRSWSPVGVVDAPLAPPGEPGVTEVDFADARHGWAFGPSLQRTTDGGRTWSPAPLPGDGQRVLDLAAEHGVVHAVVSPCPIGQPPWECQRPPTLWRTSATAGDWRRVNVTFPQGAEAILAASGTTTYVVGQLPAPAPDVFYATTDGARWSPRPSPCDKEGNGDVLASVAPTSGRDVALLCVGSVGFSKAAKTVFRSHDSARTTTPAGTTPEWGILSELAAIPGGTLAVASTSSGSWIYLNDSGAETWITPVEEGDGGAGWNDLTFTTETNGWIVYAPAAGYPGTGALLTTHNAGRTWTPAPLP